MSQSSTLNDHITTTTISTTNNSNNNSNNNNNNIIINNTSNKDNAIDKNPVISIVSDNIHDDNDTDDFEYDNNPFLGTTHLFASGIHDVTNMDSTANINTNNLLTPTRPQYLYDSDHTDSINDTSKNNPSATLLNSSSSTPQSASSPSSSSSSADLVNSNNLNPYILTLDQQFKNSLSPNNNNNNNNSNTTTAEDHRNNSSNNTTDLEPFENLSISMTLPYQKNHMATNQYIYNKDNNLTITTTTATNNNNNNINSENCKNHDSSISDLSLNDQIIIVGSGEYNDPWGKHAIGYIIRSKTIDETTGQIIEQEVTRRYSEFHSLYQVLIKLLPTVIIPPIPSKHSIFKYFLNPINVKNDQRIISMRQRRLMAFLNHCNKTEEIQKLSVFQKFLNPNYLWKDVLNSPPISVLPSNNLLAPPLNVTKPSPLHLLLPSPTSLNSINNSNNNNNINDNDIRGSNTITTTTNNNNNNNYNDTMNKFLLNQNMSTESIQKFHLNDFNKLESQLNQYLYSLQPLLSKIKNNKFHIHSLSSQFAELGAYYNALSLETSLPSFTVASSSTALESIRQLQMAIEKVGHSYDVNYVTLEILIENITNIMEEPLDDLIKYIKDSKRIVLFKNLKFVQYQIIINTIHRRKHRLNELKNFDSKMQRLDMVLKRDALSSPTIANAIKNINAHNRKTDSDDDFEVEHSEPDSTTQLINDSQLLIQLQLQKSKKRLNKRKNKIKNKYRQIEPEFLSKIERDEEIEKLNKELTKLRDCEVLIQLDLHQVIESTLKNLNYLIIFIKKTCNMMLKKITKAILNWIKECLTTWRQTKEKIDCI